MENEQDEAVVQVRARTWRPRRLLQFSLRTLLIGITLAGIACWWGLRPRVEEVSAGRLIVRREVQSLKRGLLGKPNRATYSIRWREVGQLDWDDVNVGLWQIRNAAGDVIVAGRFQLDQPHGRWTTRYPNGQKAAEGMMFEGAKTGQWRTWNEEGKQLSEVHYATYKTTRLVGGIGGPLQVESTEPFLDGLARAWYTNGKLRSEGRYAKNRREGLWKFYGEEGVIEAAGEYRNDVREGEWSVRDEGVARKIRYFEGKKEGDL